MSRIVEVDSRRRLSLGADTEPGRTYLVEVDEDGTIILSPAVVMSQSEARLLARPDILAAVERSRATRESAPAPVRRPQR